jgi:hypothetical protein
MLNSILLNSSTEVNLCLNQSGGFLQKWQEFDLPMPNMRTTGPSPAKSIKKIKKK